MAKLYTYWLMLIIDIRDISFFHQKLFIINQHIQKSLQIIDCFIRLINTPTTIQPFV